jgi:DNA-binding response OmpR family regulator
MESSASVVLIVDDDPDIRDVLCIALEKSGYRVRVAATAEDGLRLYRESRPDAVIVDLMMEEVDSGTYFVRELHLLGDVPPVFLVSSVGDSLQSAVDYGELGLSGVFQKPIDFEVLTGTLKSHLREP